jgi:hypothetical protein
MLSLSLIIFKDEDIAIIILDDVSEAEKKNLSLSY